MSKSLVEQVPDIVAESRQNVLRILESLQSRRRAGLRTREWVLAGTGSGINRGDCDRHHDQPHTQPNRLIHGDDLLVIAALLTGDDEMPSMRGHINLIYGEPQPDAAMHCRPASRPEGFEHTGKVPKRLPYGGVRTRNIASYLAALAPRLIMMRELLSEHGSIFLHLDWHTACYTKIMMDEIFNRNKFIGQIIRYYPQAPHEKAATGIKMHRIIFQYTKSENRPVNDANFQFKAGGKTDVLAWHAAKKIANPATGHSAIERPHGCMARLGGRHPAQQAPENLQLSHQQEHGALLERIIKTSSHEGSMIADFFSDSGKTAEVAERLGRRWITSDFDEPACMLARRRLKEQCVSSFVYQTIGND